MAATLDQRFPVDKVKITIPSGLARPSDTVFVVERNGASSGLVFPVKEDRHWTTVA